MADIESLRPRASGGFEADPARAWTLPADWYTDPDTHAAEREAVFGRSWHWAGHVSRVATPGAYITPHVMDQNLIVIRGLDGALRGFHNVCKHRAHELLSGSGRTRAIVCPYHAWAYDIDGSLRSARHSEAVEGFDAAAFCLSPVRVEEFCGFVFVSLDPDARPLAEAAPELAAEVHHFAPDIAELTHAHRARFDLATNWKVVVDNFLECYHCPTTHSAFVDLVEMDKYKVTTYGIHSSHMSVGRAGSNVAYGTEGAAVTDHAVWWLWPNTCFLRFPGSPNFFVLNILPAGPGRTLETLDFYFLEPEPDAAQWEAIRYFTEVLQPEDIAIVESVQRGLHSAAYDRGRFMVDADRSSWSEHGVHHFHGLLHAALAG